MGDLMTQVCVYPWCAFYLLWIGTVVPSSAAPAQQPPEAGCHTPGRYGCVLSSSAHDGRPFIVLSLLGEYRFFNGGGRMHPSRYTLTQLTRDEQNSGGRRPSNFCTSNSSPIK